ncbi:Fibronectin type III domain-containing protein 7 [Larimichthys crocea]|uniref:Uncharacterized protein n=1 Tax=Larimichthys crocea TaxID=215358 RepID=A0ACD3RM81_LARCR|nr:Fibronectin type III domain-containing protein 7 [Larimichthys crocea]
MAVLDCNANTFAVQWDGNAGNFDSYTAIAIGSDGSRVTCDSTTTQCTIQNLKCGLNYSIAVTTSSINCGIINGSDYTILSAPCKLENVQTILECSTDILTVTWENSGPDQNDVVSAVNSRGATTTCNSTTSNCTFENLSCGKTYSINVVGHTDTCSSQPAFAQRVNTAPCVPTHVTAQVDCMTGITTVTWDPSSGATSYVVYARSSPDDVRECINIDTNCNFPNLECGQVYTITVVARHDSCVSLVSESVNITTVPCPLSGLQVNLDCDTNTALVSWTPGRGILDYNATAENSAITPVQSCSTNGSSCNITSLHCGETYTVKVSGQGQNCPSPPQEWQRIVSAPCPPTHLTVDSSCESNDISVSWQASQGSASYMVMAVDAEEHRWSCNTTSTTCQIFDLPCGQQYHVYAVGVDQNCFGSKSNIEIFRTAPCVPQNVQTELACLSGVLNITWESTGHVVQFHASVVSSQGHASSCNTDENYCVVPNLQCGLTYDVTVLAEDEACNSSTSPAKQVLTAPCPLPTFVPTVDCTTGVLSVTWSNSVPGVVYTVSAVDTAGPNYTCSGTTSGCSISTLECGTRYNVTITPSMDGCVGRDSPVQVVTTGKDQ